MKKIFILSSAVVFYLFFVTVIINPHNNAWSADSTFEFVRFPIIDTVFVVKQPLSLEPNNQDTTGSVAESFKITIATAFGASFPTSPGGKSNLNSGFSKSLFLIYHTSDHFAVGGLYNAISFSPTSFTESDLQGYGLFGLYYGRVYKKLGAFVKFSLLTQTLDGGASNFGQLNGFGTYFTLSNRFCPFLGFDIVSADQSTKTYVTTLYFGLETPWR